MVTAAVHQVFGASLPSGTWGIVPPGALMMGWGMAPVLTSEVWVVVLLGAALENWSRRSRDSVT